MPRLLKMITDWRLRSKEVTPREGTDVSENELSPLSIEFQVSRPTVDDTEPGWLCPFGKMSHIDLLSAADFPQAKPHDDCGASPFQCMTRTQQTTDNGLTAGQILKNQRDNEEQVVATPKQLVRMSYHTTTSSPASFDQQATHSASSGITTLPYEILSHIFVIYTFEDEKVDPRFPFLVPDKSNGPLHICSISRQWRQIALTTPILWSSIFVCQHPDLKLVKLWLERSQSHPLTLRLAPKAGGDKIPDLRFTDAVFSLFSTQLHRWRTISFCFQKSTEIAFVNLPLSDATLLEQASLSTSGSNLDNGTVIFAPLLACPSLRLLSWLGDRYLPLSAESTFWSQLTSIDLHGCALSVSEYVTLLRHCPNTSRLALWHTFDSQLDNEYPHTILPNLQELILKGSAYDFSRVFNFFTMPALRHLMVNHVSSGDCYNNLRALLERSGCRLERFSLDDSFLTQLDVIAFFQDSIVRCIPRVSFYVTDKSMDHHACLAAFNETSLSKTPVFGKHDYGVVLMGWGEPWYMFYVSI
ncbi:hypothetical protein B0H34DRAFT_802599 [Crassisporium funariophilum]|nr:hypothetical protein B0H34DRAFT_802599 [Crassisporium funariophilum]